MKTSLLPLAVLFATVFSAPLDLTTSSKRPSWKVTNYVTGCSPAGCTYAFNISTHPTTHPLTPQNPEPAFSTHCSGTDIQGSLKPCANPSISTNEIPGVGNVTLIVQHTWSQTLSDGSVGTFWIVGNHTIGNLVGDGACFEVVQLEAYAIA